MSGPTQSAPHGVFETITIASGGAVQGLTVTGGADIDELGVTSLTLVNALSGPAPARLVYTGARVLTAESNGALCVWNTAAGYTYTLPAAATGLYFDFVVATTITSVGAKVVTASGDFIIGSILQIPDTAAQIVARAADGSTHTSWNGNGTTTGGYAGDSFRLTAISASQWVIHNGIGLATGSEATPFATS